jgi:hypothetical protein
MIEELRFLIDNTNNPKILEILVNVAKLSEEKQMLTLNFIKQFLEVYNGSGFVYNLFCHERKKV